MNTIQNMFTIRQIFPDKSISSVEETTYQALEEANLKAALNPGERVAITAGSRGISNIGKIIKTVVKFIADCGCHPSVIASMGSHGGGTVAGQMEILNGIGITPEYIGAPVLASDVSRPLPEENGKVFYVNSLAFQFDRIIVVNRIKPHTSFHGPVESGLLKMLAIGLGGPEGASRIHGLGINALPALIPEAAAVVMKHIPVTLGLAILEDSHDNTMKILAVHPENMAETEEKLLEEARRHLPGLPFDNIDILVVDEIGKVFSGTGMDTNVIGRLKIQGLPEPVKPNIKRIVVLDLARGTKGNAYGIGLADFTTKKLVDGINIEAMYLNAMTSNFVQRAMIPMTLPDDLSAVQAAVKSLGSIGIDKVRMVRIKNTLNLEYMMVSGPLLPEAAANPSVTIIKETPMAFDVNNNILPF
ncbi:MAG: hypothetical protein ACOY30_10410 [Bacillota bacterium]